MDLRRRLLPWALVPALVVAVGWLLLRKPVPEPDPATAEALETAANRWWQPGGPYRDIPEADWPDELRRLGPQAVRVHPEGVFIKFGSRYVEEWGLFVLPKGSDFRPGRGGDPSFKPLRGRVFRYDIVG